MEASLAVNYANSRRIGLAGNSLLLGNGYRPREQKLQHTFLAPFAPLHLAFDIYEPGN